MKQGGSIANNTGNALEQFIKNTLEQKGYNFIDKRKFLSARILEQPIYTVQFSINILSLKYIPITKISSFNSAPSLNKYSFN